MEACAAVARQSHAGFLAVAHLHHEVKLQAHTLFEVCGGIFGSG